MISGLVANFGSGGDNFFEPTSDFITLDTQDEVLNRYVQAQSPINIELDGRIRVVNGTAGETNGTHSSNDSESASGTSTGTASTTSPTGVGQSLTGHLQLSFIGITSVVVTMILLC